MPTSLSQSQLKDLARHGAVARIQELETEIATIRAAFPGLDGARPGRRSGRPAAAPAPHKRRPMSAAARKAVSLRMKKYWAARRAEKSVK